MAVTFWTLAALVVYVYVGYPLLLFVVGRVFSRPVLRKDIEPRVTLVISAFNEEEVIAEKIRNSLKLDYPRESLQVLVVSDASEDKTDAIVQSFAQDGVELLRMEERGGKTLGLNAAIQRARGDIVVFSDANAMYGTRVLRTLARNFADPSIGAVVGESTYSDPEVESERTEGLYWTYETWIKRLESRIGSVVGGDGAIYCIRRELYTPMKADALSDFVNPLQIVRGGHRCLYEPAARSSERAAHDFHREFRRKVRIVNRAWRALMGLRGLLNPLRHGFFSIELISHKLLRWLVPLLLLGVFATNLLLLGQSPIYVVTLIAQVAFYLLALLGHSMRTRPQMPAFVSVPYYFCLVNIASALGIVDAYRGRTYATWSTARAQSQ